MSQAGLVVLPFLVQLPLHPQHEGRRRRHLDGLDRAVRRERRGHQTPAHVADGLMVVAVDVGAQTEMIGQQRARRDVDRMRRMGRPGLIGERGRDQGSPLLPPGARMICPTGRELVEVTVERAAEGDVEDLAAPADAQDRHRLLHRHPRIVQLDLVQLPCGRQLSRVGIEATVPGRVDVATARQHQAVGSRDRLASVRRIVEVGKQDGETHRRPAPDAGSQRRSSRRSPRTPPRS